MARIQCYIDDFAAVSDPESLLDELADCSAFLPNEVCLKLHLPLESTFADAVKVLRHSWGLK
ncbi:MAG: hypothetical protein CMJ64_26335 [Planctomycetaceae bacterium]|nr:hypothetical protein [Planctomycetaceae bacterium]